MAYIYVVTNKINQKQYVGKTLFPIEKRWKEHQRASLRKRTEKRPLYFAINKYGINNFEIKELEECSLEVVNIREKFWIEKLGTFHEGYNVTLGGDGSQRLDYTEILKLFDTTTLNLNQIAEKCNCHSSSVRNIISQYRENINWELRKSWNQKENNLGIRGKTVLCIEEDKLFPSATQAANWLIEIGKIKSQAYGRSKIPEVCQGKRKTVGGYHWKYID